MIHVRSADVMRIAIEAHLHPDTVVRVLKGGRYRQNTLDAVQAAAARLGITLPENGAIRGT